MRIPHCSNSADHCGRTLLLNQSSFALTKIVPLIFSDAGAAGYCTSAIYNNILRLPNLTSKKLVLQGHVASQQGHQAHGAAQQPLPLHACNICKIQTPDSVKMLRHLAVCSFAFD